MKYSTAYCKRIKILYFTGIFALLFTAYLGIMYGSTDISFSSLVSAAKKNFQSTEGRIFLFVRLPRTVASLLSGGALAVSGVIIQGVLSNNLAAPGIIGINSGAGLAVTISSILGVYSGIQYSVFAFIGALLASIIICTVSINMDATKGTVILIGVAINSIFNAVTDIIVSLHPDVSVATSFFKLGSFSGVTTQKVLVPSIIILFSLLTSIALHNELDIITMGDNTARGLGINISAVRVLFLTLAALLAGASVCVAGLLSFVGLVIPHIVRHFVNDNHFHLLMLSFVFGAVFVCLSDTLSRIIFSPFDLPVGIIISLIGAPFFLFVLSRKRGGRLND